MRKNTVFAFVVASIIAITGMTTANVWAGDIEAEPTIAMTAKQIVFTAGGKTTIITADRITVHNKVYTLEGNFHVVGQSVREYQGQDAQLTIEAGDPGDGSQSKMLQLTTRKPLFCTFTALGSDGKLTKLTSSLDVKPGETVGMSMYLHPKTLYITNSPGFLTK